MSNVIILVPAPSRALTTVEVVREDLGIPVDAMSNDKIKRMIEAASSTAAVFCRRQFGIQTVRERIAFSASCGREPMDKILVAQPPIIEVRSITANGDVVDPDEYEVAEGAVFNLDDNGEQVPWYGRSFTLIYQCGYILPGQDRTAMNLPASAQDLPADISRAVMLLIAANASSSDRDVMIKAEESEKVGRTEYYVQGASAQLPHPEAEAILRQYQWANI